MIKIVLKTVGVLLTGILLSDRLDAQSENSSEKVAPFATFKSTNLINATSPETHFKRDLKFTVRHRFGDIAGPNGGYHTLFGIDNARDIKIGFEYGLTDRWDIGINRNKGAGPYRELYEGFTKYKIFTQSKENGWPFTLTYYGVASFSTMEASSDESAPVAFRKWQHRFTYTHQAIFARRFGDRFSLALLPTFIHRNFVAYEDQNNIFSAGIAGTYKISKMVGIMAEYFYNFPRNRQVGNVTYRNPLGIGVEIETGGHIFHLSLNNAPGLSPDQFIPYNTSRWQDGGFRFGFAINRLFKL